MKLPTMIPGALLMVAALVTLLGCSPPGRGAGQDFIQERLTDNDHVPPSVLVDLAVTGPHRVMYPAFDPNIFHYAVGCELGKPLDIALSWDNGAPDFTINGERPVEPTQDYVTTLHDTHQTAVVEIGTGDSAWFIHCISEDFPDITVEKTPESWDGLFAASIAVGNRGERKESYAIVADNNGVPWRWEYVDGAVPLFRHHPDGAFPYSLSKHVSGYNDSLRRGVEFIIYDDRMREVDRVRAVNLLHTDHHDFEITPDGDYVLMSYTETYENPLGDRPDAHGKSLPDVRGLVHSIVQRVAPDGELLFEWNSWDHVNTDNCVYREPEERSVNDYAHVNSVDLVDGHILLSMRQCMVMMVHGRNGQTLWRVGMNHLDDDAWTEAGYDLPLKIVGDPKGTFCAQHSALMPAHSEGGEWYEVPDGNLLVYDNGNWCPPGGDDDGNDDGDEGEPYSRVVEYAIDPEAGTATYLRGGSHRRRREAAHRSPGDGATPSQRQLAGGLGNAANPGYRRR